MIINNIKCQFKGRNERDIIIELNRYTTSSLMNYTGFSTNVQIANPNIDPNHFPIIFANFLDPLDFDSKK